MLNFLRKITPAPLMRMYHLTLGFLSATRYHHPSRELVLIGVTGTNGKSSTVQFIAQLLTSLGHTVGYTTTAGFSIAGAQIENRMKMTMPGRFALQRLLREMVEAGCRYAIIETSSQGILQSRHRAIDYDLAVFTNLTPEHIEAHGGFEAYKKAKGELFVQLMRSYRKTVDGKTVEKASVINTDDEHAPFYLAFPADRHVTFGSGGEGGGDHLSATGSPGELTVNGVRMPLKLRAEFQKKNALAAIASVYALGTELEDLAKVTERLEPIPGRFELVDLGQPFHVVVDYAYEPYALEALFRSAQTLSPKRIIGIHGSAGGGRDVARREKIGRLAAKEEDIVIVTNEDPYDEDPRKIIEDVADGARAEGKTEGEDLLLIDDRQEAIDKAIELAEPGDCVLLTAKGNEPVMAVAGGKKAPWSDRAAAEKALKQLGYGKS